MKILYISHYAWPHVGGVEKHIREVSKRLKLKGEKVKTISEKDIRFPHIKYFGLLYIWFWLFKNRKLITSSDIIHIHDVFIWYLPFKFIYPKKKVFLTVHGGQGKWPIPFKDKLLVKMAAKLLTGVICVGDFISKYFGIKVDYVIYGGVDKKKNTKIKKEKLIIFLGRLEKETGVYEFIQRIKKYKNYKIEFIGDGSLRKECQKYGKVWGFCDPKPFLQKASICFAGGYLSALEALEYGCELWTGADTPMTYSEDDISEFNSVIKKDYWKMFPYKKRDKLPAWDEITNEYINMYNSSK